MPRSFYPDPVFGWTFYVVLLGFLVVAAYIDLGQLKIPKKLTLSMLAAGAAFSVVRGIWMGGVYREGDPQLWGFVDSPLTGAGYGLLFALAGFAVGFAIFCALWLLGMAGGGDVKLVAALGAWVGPTWILVLIVGSMVVFMIVASVGMVRKSFRRGVQKTVFGFKQGLQASNVKKTKKAGVQRREKLIAYSLPVAIATALLVPVLTHNDLGLRPHGKPAAEQASTQP